MTEPFLVRFAVAAPINPPNQFRYSTENDVLLDVPDILLTRSHITEAKGDPTSDEMTDR